MKRFSVQAALVCFSIAWIPAKAQEKMDHRKHSQIMEMLKDSSTMDTMMDHIASDGRMRSAMMEKMIYYVKGDSTLEMELCMKMTGDKAMHSRMMKMMGEVGMKSDVMGKPTFERSVEGVRLQFWVITQEEHKKMMATRMNETSPSKGMEGEKKGNMMEGMQGGMMHHMMKHDDQKSSDKHNGQGMDHSQMDAMMRGTHHVMVVLTDEKTGKSLENAEVSVSVIEPSKTISTAVLSKMMNHFGGGLTLNEMGHYGFEVSFTIGESRKKTSFDYEIK